MKLQRSIIFIAFTLAMTGKVYAQTGRDSSVIYYYDSINYQLAKFGLPPFQIPSYSPCAPAALTSPPIRATVLGEAPAHTPPVSQTMPIELITASDDINVYWIHGLSGSVESLKIAAYASQDGSLDGTFPARKLISVLGSNYTGTPQQPAYSEALGITRAAQDWRTIANALPAGWAGMPPHSGRDFIIAHSQGGIVAREWLRNMEESPSTTPNHAHGLVTFGTPHAGAMILNNTRPDLGNKAPAFFYGGCQALGYAAVQSIVQNNFLTRLLVSNTMANTIVNSGCNVFANTIVPFALDNYHKRTTLDYYVGSPFLTQPSTTHPSGGLSSYTLKVPVVQFYGEEAQPVMWRFFSSMLKLETDAMDNSQIEFGYDNDDILPNKVVGMINDFNAKYNVAQSNYNYWNNKKCWPYALFCTPCLIACQLQVNSGKSQNQTLMNAYSGASKWLSEANDYYQTDLLGAKVTTSVRHCIKTTSHYKKITRTVGHGQLVEQTISLGPPVVEDYVSATPCPSSTTTGTNPYTSVTYQTVYRNESYYKPNDAVVAAESSSFPISTIPSVSHTYRKMNDTNHDQMKNSSQTKIALTKLYNGEMGSFFAVPVR